MVLPQQFVSSRPKGIALLITGLPAAGKTTLAQALSRKIEAHYRRPVTLLDGDEVRRLLSSELGFTREHRHLNVLRHGYLAAEVCRHGGITICALIAPYAVDRTQMRQQVECYGNFVEIHLATPLAECERRDPKGLYARARAGQLEHMTGVNDPYESPQLPDLQFDGQQQSTEDMVCQIIDYITDQGMLSNDTDSDFTTSPP